MGEQSAVQSVAAPARIGETRIRVRYAETDQMGVVYYANYLIWMELGRVEFLRQLGFDYKSMEIDDDCHIPVVEATCRYKSPARYDDEVVVETTAAVLRGYVLKFAYRILRAGDLRLLAEGETVHVVTDSTLKRRLLPEKYLRALGQNRRSGKT
ncbi:MAG: acyl-CoA thioesterase [Acidobacteriaceae bacterium]